VLCNRIGVPGMSQLERLMPRRIVRVALITPVVLGAIQGCVGDGKTSGLNPETQNVAVSEAVAGKATLRIRAAGENDQRYVFGTDAQPTGLDELTPRLVASRRTHPEQTALYVYTYPGATGYDVLQAMRAAHAAGFREVVGVADFSDDSSPTAQRNWKRWEQTLTAASVVSADTAIAGRTR